MKVAIQGGQISFHDIAAKSYFKDKNPEIIECKNFRSVAETLHSGDVDYAVMAMENTIAGSLLPNYSLIQEFKLQVVGEISLRIRMHLMSIKEQPIENLKRIESHPVALLQCQEFLSQYPDIYRREISDTANGARLLSETKREDIGVIASKAAADYYGLKVLAAEIETNKMNFTRFLILSKTKNENESSSNKASVSFQLKSEIGSLSEILSVFKLNNIDLTKIQSIPVLGKPFEYAFHVDMIYPKWVNFNRAIETIRENVTELFLFGTYTTGTTIQT